MYSSTFLPSYPFAASGLPLNASVVAPTYAPPLTASYALPSYAPLTTSYVSAPLTTSYVLPSSYVQPVRYALPTSYIAPPSYNLPSLHPNVYGPSYFSTRVPYGNSYYLDHIDEDEYDGSFRKARKRAIKDSLKGGFFG